MLRLGWVVVVLGFYNKMSIEILIVVTCIHIEQLVLNYNNSGNSAPDKLVGTSPGHDSGNLLYSPDNLWVLPHRWLVVGLDHELKENLPF